MKNLFLLSLFFLLLNSLNIPQNLYPQNFDPSASGFKYMISFPDTAQNGRDRRFFNNNTSFCAVYVFSPIDQEVATETINGKQKSMLVANNFTEFQLPSDQIQSIAAGLVQKKFFSLEVEDAPVVVYCFIKSTFGTEAWTPVPVENWGTDYYVAALHSEKLINAAPLGWNHPDKEFAFDSTSYGAAPAQAVIIANENSTKISINLNKTKFFKRLEPQFTPLVVTLNRGESYMIQTWVDTLSFNFKKETLDSLVDLAGFRITSDKPVGVISGNTRSLGMEGVSRVNKSIAITENTLKNLMIEALAPIEQHGSTFVFTPAMDTRRAKIGASKGTRKFESARVYATQYGSTSVTENGYLVIPNLEEGTASNYDVNFKYSAPTTSVIKTSKPAQVMGSAAAVANIQSSGSLPWAGVDLTNTNGGFMYEITPVEQWVTLAPFMNFSSDYETYVNVVTKKEYKDSIYYNIFNRVPSKKINFINTTNPDYLWATITLFPGDYGIIEGREGAKFGGYVYGVSFQSGYESFAPGKAKDDDKIKHSTQGSSGGNDKPMHPSEYTEDLVGSFAYPLAPARNMINKKGDSIEFETEGNCQMLKVKFKTVNSNPVGLRALRLENAVNAQIRLISPTKFSEIISATSGEFIVYPIDDKKPSSATLVIQDRTGKTWRYGFSTGEVLNLISSQRISNATGTVHRINLKNNNFKNLNIQKITVLDTSISVLNITPQLPVSLSYNKTIQVDFFQRRGSNDILAEIYVQGYCDSFKLPFKFSTSDSVSSINLFNFLHDIKWVCNKNKFTKNPISQYDTTLEYFNTGNAKFIVDTAFLRGADADAGIFKIGKKKISSGDIFYPNDTLEFRRSLDIIYMPTDETSYKAEFVIRSRNYDEFITPIFAEAIESHISATDYDFGTFEYTGKWKKSVNGEVYITAHPTRKTTITGLKFIGENADDFTFIGQFELPSKDKPWVLDLHETKALPVKFQPEFSGKKSAQILIEGDFSSKDDSLIDLIGNSYLLNYTANSTNSFIPSKLLCGNDSTQVLFVNSGSGAIILNKITLNDINKVFSIEPFNLPLVVAAKETIYVKTYFRPTKAGKYSATIFYEALKYQDKTPMPVYSSDLEANVYELNPTLSTIKNLKSEHTQIVNIPLKLEYPVDEARINKFILTINYDKENLVLKNSSSLELNETMLKNGLLYNWKFNVIKNLPGIFKIEFENTLDYLKGIGQLLDLRFETYIGESKIAKITYSLEHNNPCISFNKLESFVNIGQFCAWQIRQMEMTNSNYFLKEISPNPASNLAELNFGLGLDSKTQIVFYKADGKEFYKLLDENLKAGSYQISLDLANFNSGIYYYRLVSGNWSSTKKMIVTK